MTSSIKILIVTGLLLAALFTQPAIGFSQIYNEDCATADALTVSPTASCDFPASGSTLYAQSTGLGNCEPAGGDAWYTFVATSTAHTLHLYNVYNAYNYWQSAFGMVELFTGDCTGGQLQRFYCTSQEKTTFGEFVPGQIYYLRVVASVYYMPISFQICVTTPNQPPPANDACAGATVLSVDHNAQCTALFAGSTEYATLNPAPVCANCEPYLHNDLWYAFTATQPLHVVSLREVKYLSDLSDGVLYVETFKGDCSTPTLHRDTVLVGQGDIIFTDLVAGQTCRIRLYGNNDASGQQFNLCVTAPPPPVHDDCVGALALVPEPGVACNTLVNGSLLGALSGGQDCQAEVVRDVWYRFTATSPSHRMVLMPSTNDHYGFEVYAGNDCNSLTSLVCAASNNLAHTLTSLNVGATYFVRVFSTTTKHFDFQICLLELPLPPNNDECAGALPLVFSTGFDLDVANEGSTLGATASLAACGSGDATHDVWYYFVAAEESQRLILVNRVNIFGNNAEYGFEAYAGNCGALASLGCGHLPPTYREEILLGGLTAGVTYFVRVYSLEGSNHDFSLYLQTLPPPPLNLDCAHAEVLTSTPLPNCNAPALGNTSGVVTLEPTDCNTEGKSLWYQFTAASATEVLDVSDVNSLFMHYGAQLAVYEGTGCGALTLVSCFDVPQKIYLDNLSPGKSYFLRWSSNFLAAHTFQLCLNHFPPPANDVCAGALPLVMHGNLNCYYPAYGTTEGAAPEMPDACLNGADVWFSFKAIQATQRITVSEIVRVDNGETTSLQAQLFGGDCINLTPLLCWPAADASLTLILGDLVVGQTYYLRFANPEGTPTRFKVCALTPHLPPVNDNCTQATMLTPEPGNACSSSVFGYTGNATPTPGLPVPPVPVEGDVWYAFNAMQANHTVTIGYVNGNLSADNAVIEVYASPCGQFNLLARQVVVDNWPSQPVELTNKIYLTNLSVGATYYVRVLPESAANISFNICVIAPSAPANDDCAGAEPLLVNPDFNCATSQEINTLGATQSQLACDGGANVDVWYQFTATDVTYRFDLNDYYWSPKSGAGGIEVLGGDCGNLVSLFCREVASMPFSIQENGFVPGQTYYLRIWGEPNTQLHWDVCAMALPPAPVNDHCVDAQPLPINSGAVCNAPTVGTTLSATSAETDCHNELVPEVWYSFVPTAALNLLSIEKNVNYFNANWAGYELLTGNDCSSPTSLYCTIINGNTKTILPALTPGQTYFLRVFNYPNEAMDFSLCLTALPVPPNDVCANATTVVPNPDLHCSTTNPGSTAGATFDGAFTAPDVWYEFIADSEVLFAELLNVQQYYGQSTALYYELYHGLSCDNWQLEGRYNASPQSYIGGLAIGDRYFIRVFPSDPYSAHEFELCLQTPPPPPVNDLCINALPLPVNAALDCNQILHGTTAGAILNESQACYSGGPLYDVWYSFVATSSVHEIHQSNITGLTTAVENKFEIVALQTDDCLNFNRLGCADWGQSMRLQGLTPGETYYVAAVSRQHVYHEFDLCITSHPIPLNDACDDAVALTVSPTDACQNPAAGTAFGATPGAPAGCGANTADVWFAFTAVQSTHTILVSDVGNSPFGYYPAFRLEVFGNGCGSLQLLACHDLVYTSVDWTVGELLPGNTYWIRLNGNANFNICVSTPAPAPPNDACANAILLPVAPDKTCVTPTPGTTEFATSNGSQFAAGPYYSEDVWYTFTATQASHAVLLNNLVNSWDDFLVAEFYAGTCGMLTHLETQLYALDGQYVRLTNGLVPGQTYYVRVFNGVYHLPSNFDICILSILPPANDECVNAQPLIATTDLSCSQSLATTSLGATQSKPGCSGEAVYDVWYQFIAGSPTVRLDIAAGYGSGNAYGLEILEGDCAAPTVVVPCADYGNDLTLVLPNLSVSHTYYLRLFVPPMDDKDFTLCLRNLPSPPPNDDCAQAAVLQPSIGLACDQATDGTTVAATGSATSCGGYPPSDDVWYQFTTTSNSHMLYLEGKGYPLTGNGAYPGFELYEGTDCNSLNSVTCHYFNNQNGGQQLLEGLIIGTTYFVRIFAENNRPYDFSICLGTLPPVPANADCAGALEVMPSLDMQCVQPVSGNTGGLPESGFAACYYPANLWYHFKATAAAHFIQLQNVTLLYGNSGLSLALYKGNDCNALNSLYCDYDNREILATNLIPGADYYIRIGGYLHSGMSFDLCVLTVMPPVNDNCVNATVLTVSATQDCIGKVNGTNVGATGSFGLYCGNGPDVMYAFTATSTKHWVNISNVHTNTAYLFVEVLTGTCGNWTDYSCHSLYTNPIQLQNLAPGQTYYLRIGSDFPFYLNFEICVTTPQPDIVIFSITPSNDGCQPGSTEMVEMTFKNAGVGELTAGAAQFTLTVSGANTGTYGSLSNADPVGSGDFNGITFTGVDLSHPGQSQLTVTAILPNDYNAANNSTSVDFTSMPLLTYFRDTDNDGYGDLNDQLAACSLPFGYAENGDDCDDQNAQVHPGAAEVCNGFDDDCNGLTDAEDSGLVNAPLPDIACPADLTVANDPGLCVAVVNYTVTTTDNCGYALNQTAGLASSAPFPIGTTVNSFLLSDLNGTSADCSFSLTVQKSADPDLFYAYTVVGLNDVFLKNNLVQSGGIGVVNAGKKARLQNGTLVTAAQTFVKAPVVELTGGSQVTTSYSGQVPPNLLPAFQANAAPTSNNLTIPNNAAAVTLALASYGVITVGINATIIFNGQSQVRIKELTLKNGAKVIFQQPTDLLLNSGMTISKNVDFNLGGAQSVQVFAAQNITVGTGVELWADLMYTLKDLRVEKATATTGATMTGQFVGYNIFADDFAAWNWDADRCPAPDQRPALTERQETETAAIPTASSKLLLAPNPATETVQLSFDLTTAGIVTVRVLDLTGRLVRAEHYSGAIGVNRHTMNVSDLSDGMYFVEVSMAEQSLGTVRMVKE